MKAKDGANTGNFCCGLAAAAKDRGEGFRFISASQENHKCDMAMKKGKCKPRKYQVILLEMSYHILHWAWQDFI